VVNPFILDSYTSSFTQSFFLQYLIICLILNDQCSQHGEWLHVKAHVKSVSDKDNLKYV
jgi:hypothetical protein